MVVPTEPSCRLFAILARDGRSAAVFRRGPFKQVMVLRWWFDKDRLEEGQWFRGRIYERRCDLSPDGDLLIYFAAKWRGPYETWTAVSRTPFLTALVIWPKGDAWGGGGAFQNSRSIGLNHRSLEGGLVPDRLAKWHPLGPEKSDIVPSRYQLGLWSEYPGRGEDNPLHHHLMTRDGWTLIDEGDPGTYSQSSYSWLFNRPEIYDRAAPGNPVVLRRYLRAIYQKNGPWYVEDFEVRTRDGEIVRTLAPCSWADWHVTGDLVFARGGCLYRLPSRYAADVTDDPLHNAKRVGDIGPLTFKQTVAPEWARKWP